MLLSEELIMDHLNWHLTQSEPGAMLHHLSVLKVPGDAVTALGLMDEKRIQTDMYAIVPDTSQIEDLFNKITTRIYFEAVKAGELLVLAVLSMEMWGIPADAPDRELARRLLAENKPLGGPDGHPSAVEATMLYAAARDGRRWRGKRYLTGVKAGQTENLDLLVGAPRQGESHGVPVEAMVRALVGLGKISV